MAVPISTIVNVQISRQTRGVTQAGFGVPLIVGTNGVFGGSVRVREYLNIDEVLEDFSSVMAEYRAAAAIFSQNPKVEKVKIGVEAARVAQVRTLTFSGPIVTGNSIAGSVDGVALPPVPFNTDNATTLTDLATAIQATPGVSTAVSNGTNMITITAQDAGVPVALAGFVITSGASQATITVATTVASHGIVEDLAEIIEQDDDWYGLIWTERAERQVLTAAGAIEARRKIFGTCSSDTDILSAVSTTDIAALLNAAGYDRTFIIYNADPADFADAAWMGRCFTFDPGNETWKFKTLTTITPDNLTSAQRAAATAKRCNLYVTIGGVNITQEGVMASGEFIDIMRGVDWLQARMEERIFARLVNLPKVPYTNQGISIITTEIRAVLENGIRENLIANEPLDDNPPNDNSPYRVFAPRVTDISMIDRANRFLPDVEFIARLAGAIHRTTIQGIVTV